MNNQVESAFSGEKPAQVDAATQTGATAQVDAATQAGSDTQTARSFDRAWDQMRPVTLERNIMKNADGSCLVTFGDTRVLCTATVEEGVPAWRRGSRAGWVTAEYAMLPASTNRRTKRERASTPSRWTATSFRQTAALELPALRALGWRFTTHSIHLSRRTSCPDFLLQVR